MAETGSMKYFTIRDLENSLGRKKLAHFIRDNETGIMKDIAEIAYQGAWDPDLRAVFVSGPTSSGKTTFTNRLAAAFHMHGRPTCLISLDDYYRDGFEAEFYDGRPDFESIYTLDIPLFLEQFESLRLGRETWIPSYNFKTGRREYHEHKKLRMPPRAILLIEGLHGLNEDIIGRLNHDELIGVLIMPWAGIASDRKLLGPRDIRIFRRMSRDVLHRGTSAVATLDYWPMIDRTEAIFFPDYLARADYFVNSALAYEFMVIPHLAVGQLEKDLELLKNPDVKMSQFGFLHGDSLVDHELTIREAERLLIAAQTLPVISPDNIPENSILNEFIH